MVKADLIAASFHISNPVTASSTFPKTSTSKSITSPQYPNPYPTHLDYDWIIEAPMSLKISLTIVELDLPVCRFECDYLEVFDGLESVGKYAGKLTNVTVISATRRLRVRFHSDMFHDEAKGFRATHKLECGRRLNVSSTTYSLFQSPGYPKAFPPNSDCIYDFITEPGFKIQILIRRLDTDSCCDYLEISSDSVTLGRFRTIRSHSVTSFGSSMRLYYHTDSEGSVQRFRIRYRKVK
ncbi:unnamed protein product [Clavelina lepadiformis]|uniref:CUB domain-containing protein n=1 Tax=Clavelina lepadiformis TaxID=159417 RepID=A0ABP0EZM5_CLALP